MRRALLVLLVLLGLVGMQVCGAIAFRKGAEVITVDLFSLTWIANFKLLPYEQVPEGTLIYKGGFTLALVIFIGSLIEIARPSRRR